MNKINFTMRNEKGSIIVLAMVMLVILTLMGIWATNTSRLDVEIAANEKFYNEAFHDADAGISWILALAPAAGSPDIANPVFNMDLDNDGVDDFEVYYINKIASGPPVQKEFRSDSINQNGRVSIIAGIECPANTPPPPPPGMH